MRLDDREESENVEDRRGMGAPAGIALGGGGLILVLVMLVLGVDPRQIQQLLGNMPQQPGAPAGPANGGPARPVDPEQDAQAHFTKVVFGDTERIWSEVFSKMNQQYPKPTLVLFDGQVDSACGTADSAVGPFYCPGDAKVYIDFAFYRDMQRKLHAPGDFARAYVVAHEVGHHVQKLLGYAKLMDEARRSGRDVKQMSVRLELQADYLAGVWAHYGQEKFQFLDPGDIDSALNAANQIGDDRLQKEATGRVVPDTFTHGTSQQRMRWFSQGFKTGDVDGARGSSSSITPISDASRFEIAGFPDSVYKSPGVGRSRTDSRAAGGSFGELQAAYRLRRSPGDRLRLGGDGPRGDSLALRDSRGLPGDDERPLAGSRPPDRRRDEGLHGDSRRARGALGLGPRGVLPPRVYLRGPALERRPRLSRGSLRIEADAREVDGPSGISHSLPTCAVWGSLTFLYYPSAYPLIRALMASAVILGFLSHLLLDEICSVDLMGHRIKSSFGTAIKFWAPSPFATIGMYLLLLLLSSKVIDRWPPTPILSEKIGVPKLPPIPAWMKPSTIEDLIPDQLKALLPSPVANDPAFSGDPDRADDRPASPSKNEDSGEPVRRFFRKSADRAIRGSSKPVESL